MEYLTKYLKDSITIAYIFFLETNSVILDLQFVGNFDSGNFACGIFVDLQKAFDTADHEILIQKLYYCDIREVANN